jgi:hypothetical protein
MKWIDWANIRFTGALREARETTNQLTPLPFPPLGPY